MTKEFIEPRDGSYYLAGSRVALAHVVAEFQRGESPETIRSHYPTLTLEQVYGAITFYLGNKAEVESDMAGRRCREDEFSDAHPAPAQLKDRLEIARRQTLSRQS